MNALGIGRKDLLNYFLYQFGPETNNLCHQKKTFVNNSFVGNNQNIIPVKFGQTPKLNSFRGFVENRHHTMFHVKHNKTEG